MALAIESSHVLGALQGTLNMFLSQCRVIIIAQQC